jgi:hypothetical protein
VDGRYDNPRKMDAKGDMANDNGAQIYAFLEEGGLARRRMEGELVSRFNYADGGKSRAVNPP